MGYHSRRKHDAESAQALAGLETLRKFAAFEIRIRKDKWKCHVVPEQIAAIICELQLIPCCRLEAAAKLSRRGPPLHDLLSVGSFQRDPIWPVEGSQVGAAETRNIQSLDPRASFNGKLLQLRSPALRGKESPCERHVKSKSTDLPPPARSPARTQRTFEQTQRSVPILLRSSKPHRSLRTLVCGASHGFSSLGMLARRDQVAGGVINTD